eukprot:5362997-Lingulodinium_polyedra.AAC.1
MTPRARDLYGNLVLLAQLGPALRRPSKRHPLTPGAPPRQIPWRGCDPARPAPRTAARGKEEQSRA